jgi:hypothetical protein
VRCDDEVGVLAAGDGNGEGRWQVAAGAVSIDDLTDRADVNGVALECFDERFLELGGADTIEDDEQAGGRVSDVTCALGDDAKERLAAAGSASESIETTVLASAPLLVDESLEMLGLLELLGSVPAANVCRDDVVAIGDAHLVEIGVDDEGALGAVVGDGVVVEVEPDVRCLADLDFEPLVSRKWFFWQRKKHTALIVERLPDRARTVLDPRAVDSRRRRPLGCLSIRSARSV